MKHKYWLFLLFATLCRLACDGELTPDFSIMIPMRDGKQLPADVYLPSPDAKGLPCILLRSPAGRSAYGTDFPKLAKEGGYAVVIQETRSSLDEEGKTFPFVSDGWGALQDGHDTVEWLAKSPYTNGKIGTWGASALGITQLLMAPSNPDHLCCQYVMVAAASLYHHGIFPGGQFLKHQSEGWLGHYARDTGVISYVSQRPFYNDFWKQLNSLEVTHQVNVPGLHIGGWYDTFLQGTLSSFSARQHEGGQGARGKQKLIIGPWTHFWPLSTHFGDFKIPAAGLAPPHDISPRRWFDYYLKGIPTGIEAIPPVTYFVMGPFDGTPSSGNVWRTADKWPPAATETAYYLTPQLKLETKPSQQGEVDYVYDPCHVIPTVGGRNLFLESGPKDQSGLEKRSDIVVFTTEKLAEDLEVTGPLSAKVYFSSDQPDTDLVIRLCDVYPDGRSILISEGGCRLGIARLQHASEDNENAEKTVHELNVDLWATSLVFAKGHAVRLSISSSSYPRYEKNWNVGFLQCHSGKCQVAKNRVLMGGEYPSRLILPVVPSSSKGTDNGAVADSDR